MQSVTRVFQSAMKPRFLQSTMKYSFGNRGIDDEIHKQSTKISDQIEKEYFAKEDLIRSKINSTRNVASQYDKEAAPLQSIFERHGLKITPALEEDLLIWKHQDL